MTAVPEQAKQLESHESPMTKLNVLQRQMLVESGIDFLWGEAFSTNLYQASQATPSTVAAPAVEEQGTQATSPKRERPVADSTPAPNREHVQAQAQQARTMLRRARHHVPTVAAEQPNAQQAQAKAMPTASHTASQQLQQLQQLSWEELKTQAQTVAADYAYSVIQDESGGEVVDWLFIDHLTSHDVARFGAAKTEQVKRLFEQMLFALGLERTQVGFLPLLKQSSEEGHGDTLSPILIEQIRRLQPACIIALGDAAASLLEVNKGLLALMREELQFQHPSLGVIPVVATFSPYYLLSNGDAKAQAWQALKQARQVILNQ